MSKDEQARVRDALLQQLYTGVLHGTLSAAARGAAANDAAAAAGICINLQPQDAVLLPARASSILRLLRSGSAVPSPRDRAARVYSLPRDEAQAVSYALGIVASQPGDAAVCIVLPRPSQRTRAVADGRRAAFPQDWHALAEYTAKRSLAVLYVSLDAAPDRTPGDPAKPAPLFPTIPVDAQDALAVYRVAYECLARAREGAGPSHLRAVRLADATLPLERLEAALRRRGCFTKAWRRSIERQLIAALAG